jgi:N4-gp56 family major capsid protein
MILDIETTHKLTQQKWSQKLFKEHLEEIYFKPFMGTGMRSVICVKEELEKGAGDKLTIGKAYLLDQASGVEGTTTLEGKEQDMEFGDQTLTAKERRNAIRYRNGLSKQRTAIDLRNNAKELLTIWKAQQTDDEIRDILSATPTTNRELAADSTSSTRQASVPASGIDDIATSDVCTVKGIRTLKLHAITGNAGAAEKIRPVKDGRFGQQVFILFLDPYSLMDLKADPDYTAYATEDAKARSKFFQGGVTEIDGVIIIECDKVKREQNAGSVMVARNLLVGAGAAAMTYAGCELMNGQKGRMQWCEKEFDYGSQVGIAIGDVKAATKIKFSKEDGSSQDDNGVIQFYTASITA